jgi:hypothetical protein
MYTFGDLQELLPTPAGASYTWEMGPALKEDGKQLGYYLLGIPA